MKIKIISTILLVLFSTIFSQTTKVPKKISEEFLKLYPSVTKSEWTKEGKDYEVNFIKDEKEMSVVFNSNGKLVETETAIKISDLPNGVEKFISDLYPEYKISETAKIEKSSGEVLFEAEIAKGKTHKDLLFDINGKIKENETKDSNQEDEEE